MLGARLLLDKLLVLLGDQRVLGRDHRAAFGDDDIVHLSGLTSFDADAARALAEFKGRLLLRGLSILDADTAEALAAHKGSELVFAGLAGLDVAAAKALAQIRVPQLHLDSLTVLDAVTAAALAGSKSRALSLDGLKTLDAASAEALAEYKGQSLGLKRLATLDADTAEALAAFNGVLHLYGLTTLSAGAAKALAGIAKWDGTLCLTALDSPDSVAIAKALATRKGPLSLPNLKKLSPKTLSALIEKADIDIPLIETLELIPEPDGSPTDDFVIPEGFRQRQPR